MSLPVPLTVRVGGRMVTAEVADLAWRKEAIGGTRAITFRLARPLTDLEAAAVARAEVVVFDARSAQPVALGKITDPTKTASADGQVREVSAFGASQAVGDVTRAYVVADANLDHWVRCTSLSTRNALTALEDEPLNSGIAAVVMSADEGKTISTSWRGTMWTRLFYDAGMRVARVQANTSAGTYSSSFETTVGAASPTGVLTGTVSPTSFAAGLQVATVGGSLSTSANYLPALSVRNTGAATTGAEDRWYAFWTVAVRAVLKTATGADRLSAADYSAAVVYPHEVVNDMLGRGMLPAFDGTEAVVDTTADYGFGQLSYPDGVSAEQVLTDLMLLNETHRWFVDDTGRFHWEPLPTSVRYEVTLDGGGSFPVSTSDIYNAVEVRWSDVWGRPRVTTMTGACPILDAAGETRRAVIDLGSEVGSASAANRAGANFLADHRVPRNTGTVTVDRPIRDLSTGALVRPWEIEPGELIRVLGVESYADALNASTNDGVSVFRIHATNYTASANAAVLELDADTRSTAAALTRLQKKRTRR